MNVIVSGSLAYDYVMDFHGRFVDRIMPDKIHNLSLSFLVDRLNKQFGGTVGNIAYTLKLLGNDPFMVTAAGHDFGEYKKWLTKNRIRTDFIQVLPKVGTGAYFGVTDLDDNQIGSFYSGASKFNDQLSIFDINEPVGFVIIAPNTPSAMVRHVRECHKKQLPYLYDPAFQIDNFSTQELYEGLAQAAIFMGNDYEVALIEKKLKITHEKLVGLVPVVVTTRAHQGSIIESGKKKFEIKAATPKNVVDPTGAGDAYRAGFLTGFLRGFDLTVCGKMGAMAAVYTVEKYGTQTHTFSKKEFSDRYKENFGTPIQL